MKADFWHEKWEKREIAFHEENVNPILSTYIDVLGLERGARIFVPLCGKTRDIAWLLEQGYDVIGVELSDVAVQELFAELGIAPDVQAVGELKQYCAENIKVFSGDIFNLDASMTGKIDAIYDRAALVALPPVMRRHYSQQVVTLAQHAPQLLVTYEYDQSLIQGPPFSIDAQEVANQYGDGYQMTKLNHESVDLCLRGINATEMAWKLTKK